MASWIKFEQYSGFEILDDASKIKTPDGIEHELKPGKLFYFINPNTGIKNFAKPDVLLKRAKVSRKSHRAPATKESKGAKPSVAKKTVRASKGSKLLAHKKALLSEHAREELNALARKRLDMGGMNGQEIRDGKDLLFRIVVANTERNLYLTHITSKTYRDGYWFYNPSTGAYKKFEKGVDQPKPGNANIRWPEDL